MADHKEIPSPAEALKTLEGMSVEEIKDAVVQALRRKGRAEQDLQYYKDSYKEVINEEKETIASLMARLEFLMESNRIKAVEQGWVPQSELGEVVDEIRDATEQGDASRVIAMRGFRKQDEIEVIDEETGEVRTVTKN